MPDGQLPLLPAWPFPPLQGPLEITRDECWIRITMGGPHSPACGEMNIVHTYFRTLRIRNQWGHFFLLLRKIEKSQAQDKERRTLGCGQAPTASLRYKPKLGAVVNTVPLQTSTTSRGGLCLKWPGDREMSVHQRRA